MKKILIVLLALLLGGCTLMEGTPPKDAAVTLMDSLKTMDFEMAKTVADEALTAKIGELQMQAQRSPISRTMLEKLMSLFDYEVVSEDVSGDDATLTLKIDGLSEAALTEISSKMVIAGFSMSDLSDPQAVEDAVLGSMEGIDTASLEKEEREIVLTMKKVDAEWRFTDDTLTRLTEGILPELFR